MQVILITIYKVSNVYNLYREDYLSVLEMYAFLFSIVFIHWAKTVHMAGCINQTDESDFLASMWHGDLWDKTKQDFLQQTNA